MLSNLYNRYLGKIQNISSHIIYPDAVECSTVGINNSKMCSDLCLDIIQNKYLIACYSDGNIVIYDAESDLTPLVTIKNLNESRQPQFIKCIQWYPVDTGMFFTIGNDKELKIWNTVEAKMADKIGLGSNANWIAVSECATHANLVAAACDRGRSLLVDLVTGQTSSALCHPPGQAGSASPVRMVLWHKRDPHVLVTGNQAGSVLFWDVRKTRTPLWHLNRFQGHEYMIVGDGVTAHGGAILGMEFSEDGNSLATVGNDGCLRAWTLLRSGPRLVDVNFGRISDLEMVSSVPRQLRFSWTGNRTVNQRVWLPSARNLLQLNLQSGAVRELPSFHFDQIRSCVWNEARQQFYTTSSNTLIWNCGLMKQS